MKYSGNKKAPYETRYLDIYSPPEEGSVFISSESFNSPIRAKGDEK